jgi:chemotaxis protein methyltransferase CheR
MSTPAAPGAAVYELRATESLRIRELIHDMCGIELTPEKDGLIRSRLSNRLRALGLASFDAYVDHVERDASRTERSEFVDALTTNKTDFFRESRHFDFLAARVLPALAQRGGPVRFWSAACSSGEEPLTLAMVLRERWPALDRMDVRILGTDISSKVLGHARAGVYDAAQLRDVPPALLARYFTPDGAAGAMRASSQLTRLISYARLNLLGDWAMHGPFDVILCRNVMIYFDRATQERLVNRFYELLAPGGYLLTGHSESLNGMAHSYQYVQPATYLK